MASTSKGFTLIETLVVIGLVAILSVIAGGIFLANNRFYAKETGEVSAIIGTRQIADQLNRYGRVATSFVTSRVYSSTTYTTGAETVILQLPSIDASGNIIASTYDYAFITKDLSNSQRLLLMLEPNAASSRQARNVELTNNLSIVSFTYDNGTPSAAYNMTYRIKIDTGGRNPGMEDLHGGLTLRNK